MQSEAYQLDFTMRKYLNQFINQLKEALVIGDNTAFNNPNKQIDNVLICGLGGSGIAGVMISKLFASHINVPIIMNNDYDIPAFVGKNTLVIVSSYSGNTEETLSSMEKAIEKGAEIACITSGGQVKEIAEANNWNVIVLPGGNPPRACFAYSIVSQHFIFENYNLIDKTWRKDVASAINLLESQQESILTIADEVATKLIDKVTVVYSSDEYQGVAVRFCQQIAENSKMLCWNNKFPEMNHNEIVGWCKENKQLAVVFLEFDDDFHRIQKRMDLTKDVVMEHASSVSSIKAVGESKLEKVLYQVYLTDWVTVLNAEKRDVDSIEIEAILGLKRKLEAYS